MILDILKIKEIMCGAVSVKETETGYVVYRFTDDELAVEGNSNVHYSAGIKLSFLTDATTVKMKVNTNKTLAIRSYFAIDVLCNGELAGCITNCENTEGDFANKSFPLGEYSGEIKFPHGEKAVDIVLPHSVKCEIEYIELVNASFVKAVKKNKILLAYGDSITQGYDALHPINTYAYRLANFLDAEIFNKGLGGAPFCPYLVKADSGVNPDIITVAYGTNDWSSQSAESIRNNIKNFFAELDKKYHGIPVFAITPIWRDDKDKPKGSGEFSVIKQMITEECAPYKNVTVVDGLSLVPGEQNLFGDFRIHPNDEGFKHYAENLYNAMKSTIHN